MSRAEKVVVSVTAASGYIAQINEALSLLLVIILRGMIYTHKADYGIEDEYDTRGRTWEPLLNQQTSQASGSTKGDGRVTHTHSDIWSSRIGDKIASIISKNGSSSKL